MAGLSRSRGGLDPEPNMIPMIDLLLVLLIIFMLKDARQVMPVQLPAGEAEPPFIQPIVLEMLPGEMYVIKGQQVTDRLLVTVIGQVYEGIPTKVLYLKVSSDRTYQEVIGLFDRIHGVGIQITALLTSAGPTRPE